MFYAHFVLAKKGPLAKIWLAAHWDKKLTKAHVFETNIVSSVEGILQHKVKMALRTSGHLLLGVVRIFSRKAKYLLADCNEAFIKIKMAFRPDVVDLPEGNREAAIATITLPEVFHDFESNIVDISINLDNSVSLNQSRAEDITLKEDYGSLSLMINDAFGEMEFDVREVARDATNTHERSDQASLLLRLGKEGELFCDQLNDNSENVGNNVIESTAANKSKNWSINPLEDDGFGGTIGKCFLDEAENGFLESAGLFDDAPLGNVHMDDILTAERSEQQKVPTALDEEPAKGQIICSDEDDNVYLSPASDLHSGPPSHESVGNNIIVSDVDAGNTARDIENAPGLLPPQSSQFMKDTQNEPEQSVPIQPVSNVDGDTFSLAPLETGIFQGIEKSKAKRKRKLVVDEVKNLSGEGIKNQLSDFTDIVTALDLAPPTKRLMHWKETSGVEKLFVLPGHALLCKIHSRLFERHLTTRRKLSDENVDSEEEPENPREESLYSRLRKRRRTNGPDLSEQISVIEAWPSPAERVSNISHIEQETIWGANQISQEGSIPPLLIAEPKNTDCQIEPLPEQDQVPENFPEELENNSIFPQTDMRNSSTLDVLDDGYMPTTTVSPPENGDCQVEPLPEQNHVPGNFPEELENNSIFPQADMRNSSTLDVLDDGYMPTTSVSPLDEQLSNETYEQFEKRLLNERTTHILHLMKQFLKKSPKVPFRALTRENKRKQVAQKFYTLLVMKKQQAIELEQQMQYGELYISRGPNFDYFCHA